jgi:hypothetical protein
MVPSQRRALQKTSLLLDPGVFLAYLLLRADGKKTQLISGSMQFMKRMNVCKVEKYFTIFR